MLHLREMLFRKAPEFVIEQLTISPIWKRQALGLGLQPRYPNTSHTDAVTTGGGLGDAAAREVLQRRRRDFASRLLRPHGLRRVLGAPGYWRVAVPGAAHPIAVVAFPDSALIVNRDR